MQRQATEDLFSCGCTRNEFLSFHAVVSPQRQLPLRMCHLTTFAASEWAHFPMYAPICDALYVSFCQFCLVVWTKRQSLVPFCALLSLNISLCLAFAICHDRHLRPGCPAKFSAVTHKAPCSNARSYVTASNPHFSLLTFCIELFELETGCLLL